MISRAAKPDASIWVGANAGSGKTYILVVRLVRLLLAGVPPENLLCLTYTRNAAAEMQNRLFKLLADWALLDDEKLSTAITSLLHIEPSRENILQARILFARALETPGGLKVQTIHAFCESLLRRFPLEAGVSPQFELMDEQQARKLQQILVRDLLARPPDDDVAAALDALTRNLAEDNMFSIAAQLLRHARHVSEDDLSKRLAKLRKKFALPESASGAMATPTKHITDFVLAHEDDIQKIGDWLAGLEGASDVRQYERFKKWRDEYERDPQESINSLREIFMTTGGVPRKNLVNKSTGEKAPALLVRFTNWAQNFDQLHETLLRFENFRLTSALLRVGRILAQNYAAAKTARAMLDYDDLIAVTNQLLSQKSATAWVLYKIDMGLAHILVDEAQDTSPIQWQVIGHLAEEFFAGESAHEMARTIFVVGDEKQSIFSFQGADPKEFAKQYKHFQKLIDNANEEIEYLPMAKSRRSAPQILNFVDAVFADVPHRLAGLESKIEHVAHRQNDVGYIELWPPMPTPRKSDEGAVWDIPPAQDAPTGQQALAQRIATKIAAWLGDDTASVRAGDILILVRQRGTLVDELMRALKKHAIPVAGADRMVLLDQQVILDVLAAADFALNPNDDLSLACLLKSPLIGMDEKTLLELAYGRKHGQSLWDNVQRGADKAVLARLIWMRDQIDILPVFDFFAQLLGAQGGQQKLAARLGAEISDPLGELLRLALRFEYQQVASMQGFLAWLRAGEQEIKRDMESRIEAVRIMTVHGAKGLEAPIVFLPDICQRHKNNSRRDLIMDAGDPLWPAKTALRDAYTKQQMEAAQAAEMDENLRLLYVALTRACDRLYLGGYLQARRTSPDGDSWMEFLQAAMEKLEAKQDDSGVWRLGDEAAATPKNAPSTAPAPAPAAPDWLGQNPPLVPSVPLGQNAQFDDKIFAPSQLAAQLNRARPNKTLFADRQSTAPDGALLYGLLAHRLFEYLPAAPPDKRAQRAKKYLAQHGAALSAQQREAMCQQVLDVMAQPELADFFGGRGRAEVPIAGKLVLGDGTMLRMNGVIDLLLETPETIFLADFKTAQPPETANDIPQNYLTQMACYQALMQAHRPDCAVRCLLIWTQTGRVDTLNDTKLAACLDKASATHLKLN